MAPRRCCAPVLALCALEVLFATHTAAVAPLPQLTSVNGSDLTVSGISSGGFMAVQLHVAFSKRFRGAGVFAGGPFWCAEDNVAIALSSCMVAPELISVDTLAYITRKTALTLTIDDPIANLKDDRVWIYSGSKDTVVKPGVVKKLEQYYGNFVSAPGHVKAVYNVPAEHAFPTTNYGNNCSYFGEPFINNCAYNGASEMLDHLYAGVLPQASRGSTAAGSLLQFDQRPFLPHAGLDVSMDPTGYLYVPAACAAGGDAVAGSCGLHVALHGCLQNLERIGEQYVQHTGLNELADLHNFVILYPQAKSNVMNPKGCWDWWGYTGPDYACKLGAQPGAIMAMVDHILGKKEADMIDI